MFCSRDYKRKYEYLKQQLKKPSNVPNKIEIKVRRNTILEDSYRQVHSIPSNKVDTLKTKLWIEFDGEVSQIKRNLLFVVRTTRIAGRAGLWRRGAGVVLPAVQGDVQSVLRLVRVLRHRQLHAAGDVYCKRTISSKENQVTAFGRHWSRTPDRPCKDRPGWPGRRASSPPAPRAGGCGPAPGCCSACSRSATGSPGTRFSP